MNILANIFVALVCLIHCYIVVLEMVLWTKPIGLKTFRLTLDKAKDTAVLAANQGLYNGFLAAGLLWSLIHTDAHIAFQLKLFFLACVVVAGVYGAITVGKKILFVQALPALIALVLVGMSSN